MLSSPAQRRGTSMNKQHSNPTLAKDTIHAPEHMEASQEDLSDDQISADDEQSWSHHHTEPLHGLRFFPETPPPRIPARAAAAGTLGIINGMLGIIRATTTPIFLASLSDNLGLLLTSPIFLLTCTEAICTFGIAATMLAGSVHLFKERRRITLLAAGFIQMVVVLLESALLVTFHYGGTAFIIMQLVGLALPILIIILLRKKATPQEAIKEQPPRPETIPSRITIAAILGITTGILGILRVFVSFPSFTQFIEKLNSPLLEYTVDSSGNILPGKDYSVITFWLHGVHYGEKILALGIAVIMLTHGIRIFKNNKHTPLLTTGVTQSLIAVLEIGFILLLFSYVNKELGYFTGIPFMDVFLMIVPLFVMLILPVPMILFLHSRSATTWRHTRR